MTYNSAISRPPRAEPNTLSTSNPLPTVAKAVTRMPSVPVNSEILPKR